MTAVLWTKDGRRVELTGVPDDMPDIVHRMQVNWGRTANGAIAGPDIQARFVFQAHKVYQGRAIYRER